MILRRALLVLLVAFVSLVSSCGDGLTWCKTHEPIKNTQHIRMPADVLQGLCIALDGGRPRYAIYHGCVERAYHQGICWIYTEPHPRKADIAHEERHCAGESHDCPAPGKTANVPREKWRAEWLATLGNRLGFGIHGGGESAPRGTI